MSSGATSITQQHSSGDLSVEHFRNILTSESKNLTQLCERWSRVLEQNQKPEEINDNNGTTEEEEEFLGAIRSTIGQAKLLMSQRFKQFSDLIDNCEFNTGQMPTRLNDLSGFWEMISFQVEDVMQKFRSLDKQQAK